MRIMSCNGCRVLRKGCSDNCSIRPCLDWIKSADSQANATLFLSKFYGRAGLINLINAVPQHLRPAMFKSLLHDSCGRIVNPIEGSMGLLWTGSWQLCHNAVEAVLKGAPITQIPADATEPRKAAYDIRHVNKDINNLHSVRVRTRCALRGPAGTRSGTGSGSGRARTRRKIHRPTTQQKVDNSSETAEPFNSALAQPSMDSAEYADEIELELTLGLEPFKSSVKPKELKGTRAFGSAQDGGRVCKMELQAS